MWAEKEIFSLMGKCKSDVEVLQILLYLIHALIIDDIYLFVGSCHTERKK